MQSSKEQQGEIRKPSSVTSANDRGKQQNGKEQRSLQEGKRYQGNTSCKDGYNEGQKCYGPNEKQKILRRGGKITQNYTKKSFMTQISTQITCLEPGILECEVKWALESITMNKASGSDGIPVDLLQILKDDVVKVLHAICQQFWKTQQWPQDQKRSGFIPIPKKGNDKDCSNYCTHLICQQSNAQNSPSQASMVRELRTSRCSNCLQERQRKQRSSFQHPLDH